MELPFAEKEKTERSRFEGGNQVIRHINFEMPLQLQSGDLE